MHHPFHCILIMATEFINITIQFTLNLKKTIVIYVKWHPPNHPFITINIDGSFTSSHQQGGAGGGVETIQANGLQVITINFYCISSNQAEVWGHSNMQ